MVDLKLTEFLLVVVVVEFKACVAATLNPLQRDVTTAVDLGLQLGVLRTDLVDGMGGGHVALLPPLGHALLFLVQLADVLDGTLQNGALVLVTVRDKLSDLVDALVDGLATTTFHWQTSERRHRHGGLNVRSYLPCGCSFGSDATRASRLSASGSYSAPLGQRKPQPQLSCGHG